MEPTELTCDDLDKFLQYLMNEEIKPSECCECSKKFYGGSYGSHIGKCDECWFSQFPEEDVREFCMKFLM